MSHHRKSSISVVSRSERYILRRTLVATSIFHLAGDIIYCAPHAYLYWRKTYCTKYGKRTPPTSPPTRKSIYTKEARIYSTEKLFDTILAWPHARLFLSYPCKSLTLETSFEAEDSLVRPLRCSIVSHTMPTHFFEILAETGRERALKNVDIIFPDV